MPADRTKLSRVVFIGLAVLLFVLGCILPNQTQYSNSLAPVRNLTLTIDKSQREEFFDQLRKFSEGHNFEYRLTDFNTNGERFQFWMSREDIFITASDVPPDPTLVYIFFTLYPGSSIDEEAIDELVTDLTGVISEIPNVTITEEK